MVDNLGNQLVDACEHIGLIGEAITSTFELLDLTVDALYRSVRVGRFGGVNYSIKILFVWYAWPYLGACR
ncbi:hypothetical protein ATX76_10045 [Oenococcus oeni]|nr:hypothetical protein ATX76_10045 [Oenococcus oeni]